jgi:predicted transcriptional regulator
LPTRRTRKVNATAHEAEAWEMTCAGYTQHQIAAKLGIDQSTVSRAVKRVEERELARLSGNVESLKVSQTHQLQWMFAEAMRAWEKSKTPRKRAVSRSGDGGDGEGQETREAIDRDGDNGFLHTGMAALRDVRSLWGLDVSPALNEPAASIAALAMDILNRGSQHDARQAQQVPAEDTPGTGGTDPGGTPPVPERPE